MAADKRLVFINRTYPPNPGATGQLLHDLAPALARAGHQVCVVTAGEDTVTHVDGVTVHRLGAAAAARRRTSLWYKWRAQRVFLRAARTWWRQHIQAKDTVILMTDPPGLSGALGNPTGAPRPRIIHWVQDIHPEVGAAITLPATRDLVGRWSRARNCAWRQADAVVTLGADMAAVLSDLGVESSRLHITPNWAPRWLQPVTRTACQATREANGWNNQFVVMYSGNLGRVHDAQAIVELAACLRNCPDVRFCMVGDGAQMRQMQENFARQQIPQLSVLPPQPASAVAAMLSAADLHLVTLKESCAGLVWPSKFYGIQAVERPTLFIGPASAEIGRQIAQHGLGWTGTRADIDQAVAWIKALKSDQLRQSQLRAAAAAYHHAQLGFDRSFAAWLTLLS